MGKRKNKNLFSFVILVICLLLIGFSFYIWFSRPLEIRYLEVSFIVGDKMGFDLNSSSLTFGRVLPGSAGVKTTLIENNYNFPVKVKVLISKELSDFVSSDSNIVILPGETTNLDFNLILPKDIYFGNYSGNLIFEFRKSY